MKKLVITSIAVLGLSLGAIGQGTVDFNNSNINNPLSAVFMDNTANYYSGAVNFELWIKNAASDASSASINSKAGTDSSGAYGLLASNGWIKETPSALAATIGGGQFSFGTVTLPDVSPAGGTISLAIVGFTGNSFASSAKGGVVALSGIVTGNPGASPPGTPGDINAPWDNANTGLVLTAVPEPGTFALAGLGAAALLIFRRRK